MGAEAGEIVEVQGGHIVRSTGRKDRHSKVCTAKGPRDRRVRLSANTAIQFYDVQDRLGYDRPSKAVDWLIKKAKSAIDQLDHLPPWNPTSTATTTATTTITTNLPSASASASEMVDGGLLPPSLDSDSIADTIKSFFPVAAAEVREQHEQELNRHSHPHFPPPPQFHEFGSVSGSGSGSSQSQQDLRLSLQSFPEDPILFHHQHQHQQQQNPGHQALFAGFGWSEHPQNQRIAFGGGGGGNDGGGFVYNSLQLQAAGEAAQPLFGRGESNHMFFSSSSSQRGPLQSSNTPLVRANWIEPTPSLSAMADHHHHHHHHHHQISQAIHHQHNQHSLPAAVAGMGMGMGMGFGGGGFSGFHHIPARIQGEEEHNGGATGVSGGKPSSASSDSRH